MSKGRTSTQMPMCWMGVSSGARRFVCYFLHIFCGGYFSIFFAWGIGWSGLMPCTSQRKEAQLPVMIPKCLQDLLAVLPSRPGHPLNPILTGISFDINPPENWACHPENSWLEDAISFWNGPLFRVTCEFSGVYGTHIGMMRECKSDGKFLSNFCQFFTVVHCLDWLKGDLLVRMILEWSKWQ